MPDNTINPFIQQQEINQTIARYTSLKKAEKLQNKIAIVAFGCLAISFISLIGCLTAASIGAYGAVFPFSILLGVSGAAAYILEIPASIPPEDDAHEMHHLESTIDPDWLQSHPLASKAITNSQNHEIGRKVSLRSTVEFFEMQEIK
ncbi:MAG: hypothetical protein K1000chlam4_00623 [Chlamydiae bacterium]|nr:hypothetical protein [Chlamydiota bacterium]